MRVTIAMLLTSAAAVLPLLAQDEMPAAVDFQEPITLIPEQPEPPAEEAPAPRIESESEKQAREAGADLKQRVRYRQVKTRALQDPALQQQLDRAANAHTDAGKREALRTYYELLYARMRRIDPSLEPLIAQRENTAFRSLDQTRVTPSVLIED